MRGSDAFLKELFEKVETSWGSLVLERTLSHELRHCKLTQATV